MTDASSRVIGIRPNQSGTYEGLNYSAASGTLTINRQESANIRTNRVVQDQVQTSYQAGMTLSLDLYYDNGATDALALLWESAFRMAREAVSTVTFTSGYATTALKASAIGALEVGDILRFTDASGCLGYRRVTAITDDGQTPVVEWTVTINAAVTGATGAEAPDHRLVVGNTAKPLKVLIQDDVAGTSREEVFAGMEVDSFRIRVADQERTTVDMTLVGEDSDGGTTVSPATGVGDSPAVEVFNSKGHVKTTMLSNADVEGLDFEWGLSNSLRSRTVVGQLPAVGVSAGTARVTGAWSQYFENFTEYKKAIDDTASSLIIGHETANGAYAWSLPNIKYSDQTREHSGQDTDIIVRLPFEGLGAPATVDADQSSLRMCFFNLP